MTTDGVMTSRRGADGRGEGEEGGEEGASPMGAGEIRQDGSRRSGRLAGSRRRRARGLVGSHDGG